MKPMKSDGARVLLTSSPALSTAIQDSTRLSATTNVPRHHESAGSLPECYIYIILWNHHQRDDSLQVFHTAIQEIALTSVIFTTHERMPQDIRTETRTLRHHRVLWRHPRPVPPLARASNILIHKIQLQISLWHERLLQFLDSCTLYEN